MKKIGFLFSLIMIAAIAGLLTLSCNQVITEEFGTVILNFAGEARAIGADGLPVLNKAKIRVQGSGKLSGSFSKDFLSGEGASLLLPVGDTVELKVSALTPSARWSSKPLSLTVKAGVNSVSVKLSKKTAALHNFLFSQRLGAESTSPASFNLKFEDGTVILSDLKTSAGTHPSFVRCSKGGIYALYAEYVSDSSPKVWKMFFYDSEGKNPQEISLPSDIVVRSFAPVSDFTAGKTYAAAIPDASAPGGGRLYRLDDGRFTRFTLLDSKTEFCAVDNNRLACIEKKPVPGSQEPQVSLKIFTDISQAFQGHPVQLQASDTRNINEDIRIQGISLPNIRDIYMCAESICIFCFRPLRRGRAETKIFTVSAALSVIKLLKREAVLL